MPQPPQIGHREREILTAIVETYISTGEPVGSRTLARQRSEPLSAATIRNVMADLAEAGFLEQPHTSAGRVPTPAAFRYYVDQFTGAATLSSADTSMVRGLLDGATDVEEFLARSSHVLSLLSSGVGVTMTSPGPRNALEHIYFSRLGDHKVLAVLVTRSGLVHDRLLRVQKELSQSDLDLAARYLNENFRGWTLESLRSELARQIDEQRNEFDRLMESVKLLYEQGALATEAEPSVFVDGTFNLVVTEQDSERLRSLLQTLEEKERIADLLNAYLDTKQEAVRVVIGLEKALPSLRNFVLIGAPAHVGDEVVGSLAVIGPTRIDYQHTITAVSYIARLFDQLLSEEKQH
jgi:heat-inducible transcriptional repressor